MDKELIKSILIQRSLEEASEGPHDPLPINLLENTREFLTSRDASSSEVSSDSAASVAEMLKELRNFDTEFTLEIPTGNFSLEN